MNVERRSSYQIERKEKLFKFFEDNDVFWKKNYSSVSDYDLNFIDIFSPEKKAVKKFFITRQIREKIAELYINSECSHITIKVHSVEYEPYLNDLLNKVLEVFPKAKSYSYIKMSRYS